MSSKLFIDQNITRLGDFVDNHYDDNYDPTLAPPFSIIEFSINGACNRRCHFCPRVDENKYPNIYNTLDYSVYENLISELESIDYSGRISYSGFSEPLLTKNLDQYIQLTRNKLPKSNIGIVSNGDPLTGKKGKDKLEKLFIAGLSDIKISLYDGPEQKPYFEKLGKELGLNSKQYIIRERYLPPEKSYGITISNRAGSVNLKNQHFELKPLNVSLSKPCHYPFFKVLIDYDGAVLMCSNDWKKEKIYGNIKENSLSKIWLSNDFIIKRKKLIRCDRSDNPCKVCDVDGTLNGKKSFDAWKNYFSTKT